MTAANQSWVWLDIAVMRAVHEEQLAEHGGGAGVRDDGLLSSAMARPENLAQYGAPDICDLAASYGFGIARNHPFIDGNKRTAFVAVELFLALNGSSLDASDAECVLNMLNLASGDMPEEAFAAWLRSNLQQYS
jgi:death-on-curing protein